MEGVLSWLVETIFNGIEYVINFLNNLDPFPAIIQAIETSEISTWLSWANYWLDLDYLISLLELLLIALLVWYGVQVLLRWLKVIE